MLNLEGLQYIYNQLNTVILSFSPKMNLNFKYLNLEDKMENKNKLNYSIIIIAFIRIFKFITLIMFVLNMITMYKILIVN
jgi:hypothetical protein